MWTQSMLPVIDSRLGTILGITSIPTTDFDGTESTVDLGGVLFPVRAQKFFSATLLARTWTAISLDPTTRLEGASYPSVPGMVPIQDLLTERHWTVTKSFTNEGESPDQAWLLRALMGGTMRSIGSGIIVGPPPVDAEDLPPRVWNLTLPLKDQPACTFCDINFSDGSLYNAQLPAMAASVGPPSPSGVIEPKVRIFLFNDPGYSVVAGGSTNSLRFIKMIAADLPDTVFSYPLTATFPDGTQEAVEMRVQFG